MPAKLMFKLLMLTALLLFKLSRKSSQYQLEEEVRAASKVTSRKQYKQRMTKATRVHSL